MTTTGGVRCQRFLESSDFYSICVYFCRDCIGIASEKYIFSVSSSVRGPN